MRNRVVIGVLVAALASGGCMVSKNKYLEAVAESETARTELEKTRAQKNALETQVKGLKDTSAKLTADSEFISAELQRIKDSRDKERSSVEGRVKELEQKVKDMSAQHRALRAEYEDVKKHNESLKATVARYQKELKERERSVTIPAPSTPRSITPPVAPTPVPPVSPKPAVPPGSASSQPPPLSGAAVNVNTASAGDMVLFLGLSKEIAERIVANRPYKIKGELVAKNVMPKATFDGIKDRITVAQ